MLSGCGRVFSLSVTTLPAATHQRTEAPNQPQPPSQPPRRPPANLQTVNGIHENISFPVIGNYNTNNAHDRCQLRKTRYFRDIRVNTKQGRGDRAAAVVVAPSFRLRLLSVSTQQVKGKLWHVHEKGGIFQISTKAQTHNRHATR